MRSVNRNGWRSYRPSSLVAGALLATPPVSLPGSRAARR
jgi:hypothetical protein